MLEITKTNCESARESGNSVADVVEEMIDEALAIASEYLDFGDAPELLERGRKKINRLENYNYALNNLKQHMMDMEYNMNLDMYAVIRAQGDTELEFDEFNPSMVTHDMMLKNGGEWTDEEIAQLKELESLLNSIKIKYGEQAYKRACELIQIDEDGQYNFEKLLNQDEISDYDTEVLASIYEEAYRHVNELNECTLSADIIKNYTEKLFEVSKEMECMDLGVQAEYYYVSAKNGLIDDILRYVNDSSAIYSLTSNKGSKIEIQQSWFESSWKEWGKSIPELEDFKNCESFVEVVLTKTELGVYTYFVCVSGCGEQGSE